MKRFFAVVAVVAVLGFAGCDDGDDDNTGDKVLSGNISISPATATVGMELSANYSGNEAVNYQWNKGGSAISGKTAQTFTPTEVGTYTVTVSLAGYKSKTSGAVMVAEQPKEQSSTLTGLFDTNEQYPEGYSTTITGYFTDSEWTDIPDKIETALEAAFNAGNPAVKNRFRAVFGSFGFTIVMEKADYESYQLDVDRILRINIDYVLMASDDDLKAIFAPAVNVIYGNIKPSANPISGGVLNDAEIALSVPNVSGTYEIWYTINGNNPIKGSPSIKYTTPITITGQVGETVTIKAIGFSPDYTYTYILEASYFIVDENSMTAITNEIKAYLSGQADGESADNPVSLSLNIDLGRMTGVSGWSAMLTAIENTEKFVSLDLSACTMIGTLFNPDETIATGKDKIVCITLPTIAKSTAAGIYPNASFRFFTDLKEVTALNVIDIAYQTFTDCTSLTKVNFPKATYMGAQVFYNCQRLSDVNLPEIENIGYMSFISTSLRKITLGTITEENFSTYSGMDDLRTVYFSAGGGAGTYTWSGGWVKEE
jgi:hypothetical protein